MKDRTNWLRRISIIQIPNYLFLFLLIVIPIIIRFILRETYHSFDVGTFEKWTFFLHPYWNVYNTECYCNYPIVGIFLSTFIIKSTGSYQLFFLFLALFESLNAYLVYRLFRQLGRSKTKSQLFALFFLLLPSTLAGGALWGQIDHIGLTFLLLIVLILIYILKREPIYDEKKGRVLFGMFFLLGTLFYIVLFTKQLMLFPAAPIGFFLLLHALIKKNDKRFVTGLLWILIGFLVWMLPIDFLLGFPRNNYFSHYQYVLENGSDHMDIISGDGITMWQFFYDYQTHTSLKPLLFGISPKTMGLILFFLLSGVEIILYVKSYLIGLKNKYNSTYQMGILFLFIAIFNLTFNLFLSGTHERYLFYFYPFLLFACISLNKVGVKLSKFDCILFLVGSVSYGLFVFAAMRQWMRVDGIQIRTVYHDLIVLLHVIIFVRLLVISKRMNIKPNDTNGSLNL